MKNLLKVEGNIYCAGVYGMRYKDSENYLYIGSSLECNDAMSRHLYSLKRGLYEGTNKEILQEYYDMGELVFEIIKESSHDKVSEMSIQEKEDLHKALSVLEEFYIGLYTQSVCNKQRTVKRHSSNKNGMSTYRRSLINRGSKNPNSKYNERIIAEILWLKINDYKSKEIEEMYENIGIKANYIYTIGLTKWINLEPIKPEWYIEKETSSVGADKIS